MHKTPAALFDFSNIETTNHLSYLLIKIRTNMQIKVNE